MKCEHELGETAVRGAERKTTHVVVIVAIAIRAVGIGLTPTPENTATVDH